MKIIKYALPMAMVTTTAFASSLLKRFEPDAPPPRLTYFDFYSGGEADTSYTIGLELQFLKPTLDQNIGHTGYVAAGASDLPQGKNISFNTDLFPYIQATSMISNRQSGQILLMNVGYHNKPKTTTTVTAPSSSYIQINGNYGPTGASANYSAVTFSDSNQSVDLTAGVRAYSLQYKGFALDYVFGGAFHYLYMNNKVAGTQVTSEDIDTHTGKQESLSGGIWYGGTSSLVIKQTTDYSFYFTSGAHFTTLMSYNQGFVSQTITDGITGAVTVTDKTALQEWTSVYGTRTTLGFGIASLPTQTSPSFFQMQFGIGQNIDVGGNMIDQSANGTSSSISNTLIYLNFLYTT